MGRAGELIAASFLEDHGLSVLARNVEVDGGELDLVALDSGTRVAVEVRTITGAGDPADAVDAAKRRRVRRLASRVGAGRVDFIGIRLGHADVVVHWVPGCG